MSLFVVFEGGEGSGKSTQAHRLATALKERGIPFLLTYEPGDTNLGGELRKMLLDRDREPMSKRTEALLFAADRSEHVDNVIRPALARGEVVICDRYIASNIAYQGYAQGLSEKSIRSLSEWASGNLYPDVTIYLDVPPKIGVQRACTVKKTRFEDKDLEFHQRVAEGFDALIEPSWLTLDAREPIDFLAGHILPHVLEVLRLKKEAQRVMEEVYTRSITTVSDHMQQLGFSQAEIDYIKGQGEIIKGERAGWH